MSNVVSLFPVRETPKELGPVDPTGLILAITNWAEEHGVDVYNDIAFEIRVTDLVSQLQVMAQDVRNQKIA